MSQQQEMIVERLISIIRSVQLRRQTGTLIAKRGEGITYEEGSIVFVGGHVTQASVGRRGSSEALNWLSTWGHCRYAFIPSTSSEYTTQTPPASSNGLQKSTDRLSFAEKQTKEFGVNRRTVADNSSSPPSRSPQSTARSAVPYRTRQLENALRQIEHRGLSRPHRHLFYLIDGRRSIEELVRILKRDESEVIALLRDLEQATVINVPPPLSPKHSR